jgi:methylmalonyl-CoA mutase cobalamin-binding domain/chain
MVFALGSGDSLPGDPAVNSWRERLTSSLVDCDRDGARSILEQALLSGLPLDLVLTRLIHPAMDALGDMWTAGEVTLTQQFVAACAIEEVVEKLAGRFPPAPERGPKVVVGTLADGHALGAKLVSIFLRAAGLEVVNAGVGLSPRELTDRALDEEARVLAVSMFLLRSASYVPEIQQVLGRHGHRVKLAVGGPPFRSDPELARRVGADGWASNAYRAVSTIKGLMNGGQP